MEVSESIHMKRAGRQYTQQSIPKDIVHHILSAGRRAQSDKNTQPWHFIAIREPDTLEAPSSLGTCAGYLGESMKTSETVRRDR